MDTNVGFNSDMPENAGMHFTDYQPDGEIAVRRPTCKTDLDEEFRRVKKQVDEKQKALKEQEKSFDERQENEAFEKDNEALQAKIRQSNAEQAVIDKLGKRLDATTNYDDVWLAIAFWFNYNDLFFCMMPKPQWYVRQNGVWRCDEDRIVVTEISKVCAAVISDNKDKLQNKTKNRLNKNETWNNIEKALLTLPGMKINQRETDKSPDMVGTPAGVLNLRTNETTPADKGERLVTMSLGAVPINPDKAKLEDKAIYYDDFLPFIKRICDNNDELESAVRWWMCYSLTGYTQFHKFFYLQGSAGVGKSSLIKLLAHIAGNYAVKASETQFLRSGSEKHTTYDARLKGRRIVYDDEFRVSQRDNPVNSQKIFDYSAGGKCTANQMHQNPDEFDLMCKLWFASNDLPTFANEGKQLDRRLVLMQIFGENTPVPMDKLQLITGLILWWILQAAPEVYKAIDGNGTFCMPQIIKDASHNFAEDEDELQRFFDDCFVQDEPKPKDGETPVKDEDKPTKTWLQVTDILKLQNAYATENDMVSIQSTNVMGRKLKSKGFKGEKKVLHHSACTAGNCMPVCIKKRRKPEFYPGWTTENKQYEEIEGKAGVKHIVSDPPPHENESDTSENFA